MIDSWVWIEWFLDRATLINWIPLSSYMHQAVLKCLWNCSSNLSILPKLSSSHFSTHLERCTRMVLLPYSLMLSSLGNVLMKLNERTEWNWRCSNFEKLRSSDSKVDRFKGSEGFSELPMIKVTKLGNDITFRNLAFLCPNLSYALWWIASLWVARCSWSPRETKTIGCASRVGASLISQTCCSTVLNLNINKAGCVGRHLRDVHTAMERDKSR